MALDQRSDSNAAGNSPHVRFSEDLVLTPHEDQLQHTPHEQRAKIPARRADECEDDQLKLLIRIVSEIGGKERREP